MGPTLDIADKRDLTFYQSEVLRGAPVLNLLGAALVPAFALGAVVLAWNFIRTRHQKLVVGHDQIWFASGIINRTTICLDRRDVRRVEVHQSWLQKKLGSGDVLIYGATDAQPILVPGLLHPKDLKRRLSRHLLTSKLSLPKSVVQTPPIGTAVCAPRKYQPSVRTP